MKSQQAEKTGENESTQAVSFRGHINFALGLFERMSDRELRKVFTHDGKAPPTVKQIRAELKRYRDGGYKFFPPCDNVDQFGACKGH